LCCYRSVDEWADLVALNIQLKQAIGLSLLGSKSHYNGQREEE
jgi:hypothetical protein